MSNMVLDRPGVYLFPGPTQVSVQIDRELLVVFAVPTHAACGFVLYDPHSGPKDLLGLLDTLHEKLVQSFQVEDQQVAVKVFGLSRIEAHILPLLQQWLGEKRLFLAARDVGRNVGRNLSIDCRSGKVGATYAEAYLPGFPQFLSRGSARQRLGPSVPGTEVLVLSRNAVCRQLTLQAVEEQRHWSASVPINPEDMWVGKEFPYFPWSWVILFQDVEDEESLYPWLREIHARYPRVQYCWVGTRLPAELETLPGLVLLPPLDPYHLGEFKAHLREIFSSGAGPQIGDVIRFPAPKKKKRG